MCCDERRKFTVLQHIYQNSTQISGHKPWGLHNKGIDGLTSRGAGVGIISGGRLINGIHKLIRKHSLNNNLTVTGTCREIYIDEPITKERSLKPGF